MAIAHSARVHPTALLSPDVELGENCVVGPYVVMEGAVRLGADCTVRSHVLLVGPLTMGRGNQVYSGVVLGERPQHLKYNDEPTRLEIGDYNIFREHVTVHRGMPQSWVTRIGNHNLFMANCHVGHDCQVGNHCILANGALVAGHCVLEDQVYLSGNATVHQFVRLGRLSLLSGNSAINKDIPPFIINLGLGSTAGINVIGMRRAGLSHAQIQAVHVAYRYIFKEGMVLPAALERLEKELGHVDVIQEMIAFLRQCKRGVHPIRSRSREEAA